MGAGRRRGGGGGTQNAVGARGRRECSSARNHDPTQSGTLRAAACAPARGACRHEGCRRISRVVERLVTVRRGSHTRYRAPPPPRAPTDRMTRLRALAPRAASAPSVSPLAAPRDRPPRRVAIADRRAGAADRDRAAFAPLPRSPPPPHPRAPRGGVYDLLTPPRRRAPGAMVEASPRAAVAASPPPPPPPPPPRTRRRAVPGGDAAAADRHNSCTRTRRCSSASSSPTPATRS